MYDLATLHEEGRGVTRDPDKAQQLYQTSAKMGNYEAQKRLAQLASHK
jgi:TPR repeat protein